MSFDPTAARSGAVFSDVPHYLAAWVCYINGIEIPVMAWQVECQIWQVPSFTIHCLPDPAIQRLGTEDRVPVQIFYLDHWAEDKPKFRLLVDGEIVGWHFSSTTGTRTIAFSCLGHIHIFQQLYFFFMTNVDDIVASRDPGRLAQGFSTPGLLYPYALFHQGLLTTSGQATAATPRYDSRGRAVGALSTQPTIPDDLQATDGTAPILCPYELVTNVVKGVISSTVPTERRAVPMMNFFARYIRKTRFHNRWVRLPLLEDADALDDRKGVFPIFNAARNDEALNAMQRQIVSQVGSSGPVWNLFQQVLNLVYMEIAMIPNPACVRVKLAPLGPNKPEEGRILRPLSPLDALTTYRRGITASRSEDSDPFLRQAIRDVTEAEGQVGAEVVANGAPSTPAEIAQAEQQAAESEQRAIGERYQILINEALDQRAEQNQSDVSATDRQEPVRLAQYFVKPNFFFGETPSCNVILPSMIDSWTFDESYINQPTRVYVNDSVMTQALRSTGSNREFMLHALTVGWPEEANALMHHKVGAEENVSGADHGGESGKNLLVWPEEFYKGPVVARAAIPTWFQMLRQFANGGTTPPRTTPPTPGNGTLPQSFVNPASPGFEPIPEPAPIGSGVLLAQPEQTNAVNDATTPGAAADASTTGPGAAPPGAPGAPDPALPGSQFAPASPDTRRGLTRILVENLPAYAVPTPVFIGGQRTGREVVRLAVGGGRAERVCLQRGSGLDPATYVQPQITAPWPLTRNPANARPPNRRGRSTESENTGPTWRQVYRDRPTRVAIMINALSERLRARPELSALPEDQLRVAMFGLAWLIVWETGMNFFYSWALANQKQYRRSPRRTWTINPFGGGPTAYIAARSLEESIDLTWDHLTANANFRVAVDAMLTGRPSTQLAARIRAAGGSVESTFWARQGTIRPDLFYIQLLDSNYTEGLDAAEGVRRTGAAMQEEFTLAKAVLDSGRTPAPISFVQPIERRYQKPLYPPEKANLLNIEFTDTRATGEPTTPGQNTGNGSGTGTNTGGSRISSAEQIEQGDQFSKLFELYAQYEYLKQRYGQRAIGANLRFNPYIVVGFPSMLFDSMRTGMHSVGYVVGVSHSANANSGGASMSTSVRMQFCRTMQEFIYDVRTDAARFNGRVTSAPAEIIDEIRAVIQDDANAERFYQRLLYGGQTPRRTPACFRWDRVMTFSKNIRGQDIIINGDTASAQVENEQAERAARQAAAEAGEQTSEGPPATQGDRNVQAEIERAAPENNLQDLGPLSPKLNTAYADAFDNYHVAMQLASRPACSLEDFIRFWHAGETVQSLINRRLVTEPKTDFAYAQLPRRDVVRENADGTQTFGTVYRTSAVYYGRIFRMRLGPGEPPTEDERGYTDGPEILPTASNKGVADTYPETRANWDEALELYRDRVRKLISPTT